MMSMYRTISCVVGRGCLLWPIRSLGKTVSYCPASFHTPSPNIPVTPGISWLPTFAFQSPKMKITSFLLVLEGFIGLHRIVQFYLLQHLWLGHGLELLLYWMVFSLGMKIKHSVVFFRWHPSTAFQTLLLTMRATPFLLRDSFPQ